MTDITHDVSPQFSRLFSPQPNCWYLTGATASGKTEIAHRLATSLQAEIISLDSMAVYRGMDVGTAKPTLLDRQRLPHHLIDVIDPDQQFSLAEYLTAAHRAIQEIQGRGKQVLFVGGTPLYLKSLLRGVCEGPPADPSFRTAVASEIAEVGLDPLRQRLAQVDPLSATKLHPNDVRRMIRALEVYALTGRPISHFQMQFDQVPHPPAPHVFVLGWPREHLHERINERVESMFVHGFVEEVQRLIDRYRHLSPTAIQGVGYREVLDLLQGEFDLPTTIERVKIRTRRFARRQETWFRGLAECQWIPMSPEIDVDQVLSQIVSDADDSLPLR